MGSHSAALIMEEAAARRRAAETQTQTKTAARTTVTDASLAWLLPLRTTADTKAADSKARAAARAAAAPLSNPNSESESESESFDTEAVAAAAAKTDEANTLRACKKKPQSAIPFAQPGEDIAALLVRLSRSGADMMNSRQYERHWMHAHYTRDYAARVAEQGPGAAWMSMAESLAHFRAVAALHPHFHIGVVDGAASVDERRGVAEVFQRLEITGQPPGMVRPGMVVLEWRRQADGRWMCCRLTGLNGVTGSGVED